MKLKLPSHRWLQTLCQSVGKNRLFSNEWTERNLFVLVGTELMGYLCAFAGRTHLSLRNPLSQQCLISQWQRTAAVVHSQTVKHKALTIRTLRRVVGTDFDHKLGNYQPSHLVICQLPCPHSRLDWLHRAFVCFCLSPCLSFSQWVSLVPSFGVRGHPSGQLQREEPERKWHKQKESKPNNAAMRLWSTCWFRGSVHTQRALCEGGGAPYSWGVLAQSHTHYNHTHSTEMNLTRACCC